LARVEASSARETSITRWSIVAPIARKQLEAKTGRDLSPFRSRLAQAVFVSAIGVKAHVLPMHRTTIASLDFFL
jgi:hypothetical protein